MQLFIAQAIVECGADVNVELTLHENYGYRYGCGNTTAAVQCKGMNEFIMGCLEYCRRMTQDDFDDERGFYQDLLKMMTDLKMDNMGKGYIYY